MKLFNYKKGEMTVTQIAIIIVVLLLILLLASSGGGGSFIGKWAAEEYTAEGELTTSQTWTFYENNKTVIIVGAGWTPGGYQEYTWEFNWGTSGGKLTSTDWDSPFNNYRYEFYDGGNAIRLYDSFDTSWLKYKLVKIG